MSRPESPTEGRTTSRQRRDAARKAERAANPPPLRNFDDECDHPVPKAVRS
jgi:hypothetical protein